MGAFQAIQVGICKCNHMIFWTFEVEDIDATNLGLIQYIGDHSSIGLSNDMGDSTWTLKLEVGCSMGDMTNVTWRNEMAKSSSWILQEC